MQDRIHTYMHSRRRYINLEYLILNETFPVKKLLVINIYIRTFSYNYCVAWSEKCKCERNSLAGK